MSKSDDPGHYFQTSSALATSSRKAAKSKNAHGDPITFPSKILAIELDPASPSDSVYIAEAAGSIKHLNLTTKTISPALVQATAPLTSLSIGRDGILYAGCWDKLIYRYSLTEKKRLRPLSGGGRGHGDFVKTVLAVRLPGKLGDGVVSGGADGNLIFWGRDGEVVWKVKVGKSLQWLVIDPGSVGDEGFEVWGATSEREIRRWKVKADGVEELEGQEVTVHETSVYRIRFDGEGDLWTASADKMVKRCVKERDWEVDTSLEHEDFVKDVVFVEEKGLVLTACRDEEVRVWDANTTKVVCTYTGHYEEVTGLVVLEGGNKVISSSIDGTIRSWGLQRADMDKYREELEKGEETTNGKKDGLLTAEEEAELAELMDDDD